MECKYCSTGSIKIGKVSRPEDREVDEISLSAWMTLPDMYDDDIGVDNPCISVSVMAAETAYLLPKLEIPIEFCPFCERKI